MIPYSPDAAAAHTRLAGLDLGVGRDGVLEVEDQRVGRQALGLLERPLVGAGHVQHRAARPQGSSVISLLSSSLRTRRPRPARGRDRRAACASSTITWHCFTDASSCILPSIITAPVPSPISSMTRLAHADLCRDRARTPSWRWRSATGCRLHAPTQPSRIGVAELVLAGDGVPDVAERPVVRQDAVGHAGVDHAGDRVVPQVLLEGGARRVGVVRVRVLAHEVAGVAATDPGGLHAPVGGEVGRTERQALHPRAGRGRSPRRWPRPARSRAARARRIGRRGPARASSWASRRST